MLLHNVVVLGGCNLVKNEGKINNKAHRGFETERVGVLMAFPLPFSSFESVVTGLLGRPLVAFQSLPPLGPSSLSGANQSSIGNKR
jgi:hypothetical protein